MGRRTKSRLSGAQWHVSSYSGGNNECVEIACNLPRHVPVRDTKNPSGPVITFTHEAWKAFLTHLA
ncbi:DUF397 domain-containing protein [Streptomyces sp. NA04227]|nr:DUF397 domain-containing protein [Streptomyces sp. NA04227]QKW11136.1 DUF397 domain-containing protein [Streptomyces sp. NA04227]